MIFGELELTNKFVLACDVDKKDGAPVYIKTGKMRVSTICSDKKITYVQTTENAISLKTAETRHFSDLLEVFKLDF